ncbi:MAG: J domain-containing protein [Sulfurimonadaceae bacterium]|jgi:preprotein translocase subunit Sec63|nr:J domain-containing protein [Sulfurimonadaceae bacterium]
MKSKTLLGLREKSTLKEIKSKYKHLMKKWHPDKHKDDQEKATQMSMQINEAYEVIMHYCENFEFPLDEEYIKKTTQTPEEWWNDRFNPKSDTSSF